MLEGRVRHALHVVVLTAALVCPPLPTHAQPRPQTRPAAPAIPVVPVQPPIPTSCWNQPRYFDSLKYGTFEYCRGHLRYEPGALDCYYFSEQVCWVFLPGDHQWTQTHSIGPATEFPCPDAPEPPVCPRLGGH